MKKFLEIILRDNITELRDNVNITEENYMRKRYKGANCFATAMLLANADTIGLVQFFVNGVAEKYPNKQFNIEYDGYYSIIIKCDNQVLYDGNVVEVEQMFREGSYKFRDEIENLTENCTTVF